MKKELDVVNVNEWKKQGNRTGTEKQRRQETRDLSVEERKRRRKRQRARAVARKRRQKQKKLLCLLVIFLTGVGVIFTGSRLHVFDKVKSIFAEMGGGGAGFAVSRTKEAFLYESAYEDFLKENQPQALKDEEVYANLKELAEEYEELEMIYENREIYPVKLLTALCNNPEMYEYVKDYPVYNAGDISVAGKAELTKEEKEQKYPLFLQWDKRWGYEEYGDFNIALSGCGPTTLAMAAVTLTGDMEITPDKVAEYSMKNGYYVEGTGTAWSLMTDGCEYFNIQAEEIVLDEFVMKKHLDEGKVIICSVGKGDFTSQGHFILIYDYDEDGFCVNDPNCIYRSSISWEFETLKPQIRILWAFK